MAIFYVYQNQTYAHEHDGGYVWSPQRNKSGGENQGYRIMTEIRKGDFIIHHASTAIQAISIALTDCYDAQQPGALKNAKTDVDWDNEGYRVDVEYVDFDVPLNMRDCKVWLAEHWDQESAFNHKGTGKQQYMCHVSYEHVRFLMEQAKKHQRKGKVLEIINRVYRQAGGEVEVEEEEYTDRIVEKDWQEAQRLTGEALQEKAREASRRKVKPRQTTTTTYYRNPVIAKAAKERAGGVCQLCGMPAPFEDKDGNPYLESHHIIWLSAGGEDTVENTVALCPNCHKRMHVLNEDRVVKVLQSRNRRR